MLDELRGMATGGEKWKATDHAAKHFRRGSRGKEGRKLGATLAVGRSTKSYPKRLLWKYSKKKVKRLHLGTQMRGRRKRSLDKKNREGRGCPSAR